MTIQFRRWLPILALFGVLLLLTMQPGAASVQAAAQSTDTPTPAPPVLAPRLGSIPITAQNAAQVKQLMQIGSGGAQNVCLSPDGNTLAATTSIGLQLYNAHDWSKASIPLGPAFNASACTWSPHSRYIALTNGQPSPTVPWKVAIWRVSDGTLFKVFNDASAVVWSPDGQSFITIDTDKHVRMWNGVNAQFIRQFDAQTASWSPDSRFVAFIDNTAIFRVWSIETNALVFFDFSGWSHFAWSPNSHWLAVRTEGGTVGIALVSGQKPNIAPVVSLKQTGWNDMSWSPDSAQLATAGNDGTLVIWNVMDRSQTKLFTIGHPVMTADWSPTEAKIALSVYNPNAESTHPGASPTAIELLDLQSGKALFDTFANDLATVVSLWWSPSGHYLVSHIDMLGEGDGFHGIELHAADSKSNEPVLVSDSLAVAWSSNDEQIAIAYPLSLNRINVGCCGYTGQVDIYKLGSAPIYPDSGLILRTENDASPYVGWSPNGQYLAWDGNIWQASDNTFSTDNIDKCRCQFAFTWGPDSDLAATSSLIPQDGIYVNVFSLLGNVNKSLELNDQQLFGGSIPRQLAIAADGHTLAFGVGNVLYVWSIDSGNQIQAFHGHTAPILTEAYSPDSQLIASGSIDTTIRIWKVGSSEPVRLLHGHTNAVNRVVWSADGKQLASASDDQTVRIWDADTGALLQTLKGHTDSVVSVQWSPDGKLLASASKDGTIRLWDAVHGTLLNTVRGHVGAINDLSWSPDGKTLATAGADATIRLWGVP